MSGPLDRTLVAFDGRRRVAVARQKQGGWLVVGDSLCWLDAKGKTNIFGIVSPNYLFVKDKRTAKKYIDSINN